MINGATKLIIGTLSGIVITVAGWNETRQWTKTDDNTVKTEQNAQDLASIKTDISNIKELAADTKKTSKENNDKLDTILRKLEKR